MENEENNLADPIRASESSLEDSSGRVELSANTIHRLEKLARWRIDPASVKFPQGALKFQGGYAEVSRALLGSSTDATGDHIMDSNFGSFMSSDGASKAAGNKERQEVEGSDEEGKRMEEQKSIDETPRRWKLALRESEFLVKLSHENIIELEGFVEDVSKGMIWLVFPWEENGTLKDFIASADWEIPERISLIRDVAEGVEYLHSSEPPICHGDLKSINILVNSDCIAVITDFGSASHPVPQDLEKERARAKIEPQPAPLPEATFHPLTNTITLTCNQYTLRWAAPELLAEDEASLASDIWALGCVVYEVSRTPSSFKNRGSKLAPKGHDEHHPIPRRQGRRGDRTGRSGGSPIPLQRGSDAVDSVALYSCGTVLEHRSQQATNSCGLSDSN
ncbi:hypothetical protein FS837_010731 [Tulasnella sp. UAMH 9824]|nr:hypothetical protein FS837_010731 [Tulasnella sp. UAMH 9824]